MDAALHKEVVLMAWLKPWLEEAYAVTGIIEGKLETLQAMQQKLQADSAGAVTEKIMEDAKHVATQCTAKVAVIWVELDGIRAKISMSTELLEGESWYLCWGLVGSGIPQGQFVFAKYEGIMCQKG